MQRRTFLSLVLAGAAGLGLAGCGFRLRGLDSTEAVLPEMALAGPDSDLARLTAERLESAEVSPAPFEVFRALHPAHVVYGRREEE